MCERKELVYVFQTNVQELWLQYQQNLILYDEWPIARARTI